MSKEFRTYSIPKEKLEKLEQKKLVRDLYFIFEESLNYGRYEHAITLALLPELEGQIPQEKIRELKDGLSDIIKRLDKLQIK